MLFNSLSFAIFLPIVFVLYWFVFNRNVRLQNFFVLAASYMFYGWWDWRFLLLIAFTSFCSWASGLLIAQYSGRGNEKAAKWVGVANIVLNLALLAFFKYFNFFVQSFVDAFASLGVQLHPATLKVILPVGISFYTFQAISYSIDVYKRKMEATKDIVAFFAFVAFFPQLVAGPIERATHLLPQFCQRRVFNEANATDGMRQLLWGFFKKIVVADNCAVVVDIIFKNNQYESGSTLLLGAVLFAFQIYGDFSGYSDIAIGCARLFGISLKRNFNYPYFSRDIAEFWRRWHISLTTWFRDYIYIPLGGSRATQAKVIRNTFVIFIVSGLWHGANWTYVVWGLYHALLFLPMLLLGKNRRYVSDIVAKDTYLPSVKECCQVGVTFLLVVIGWVFFRAQTITEAVQYLGGMFDLSLFSKPGYLWKTATKIAVFSGLFVFLVEWFQRKKQHGLDIAFFPGWCRRMIYVFIVCLIVLCAGTNVSFIYFQF